MRKVFIQKIGLILVLGSMIGFALVTLGLINPYKFFSNFSYLEHSPQTTVFRNSFRWPLKQVRNNDIKEIAIDFMQSSVTRTAASENFKVIVELKNEEVLLSNSVSQDRANEIAKSYLGLLKREQIYSFYNLKAEHQYEQDEVVRRNFAWVSYVGTGLMLISSLLVSMRRRSSKKR